MNHFENIRNFLFIEQSSSSFLIDLINKTLPSIENQTKTNLVKFSKYDQLQNKISETLDSLR